MTSKIVAVAIDCRDVETLVSFWCGVLDYHVVARWQDQYSHEYVEIGAVDDQRADGIAPVLLFQPVPEEKTIKNRLHLDIAPTMRSQDDDVERCIELGARLISDDQDLPWVVLADPEGNEFCVLPSRPQTRDSAGGQ